MAKTADDYQSPEAKRIMREAEQDRKAGKTVAANTLERMANDEEKGYRESFPLSTRGKGTRRGFGW